MGKFVSRPLVDRFNEKVRRTDGCWLWISTIVQGYGHIWTGKGQEKAHRVSWKLHRGPIPPGKCVLHHCDVPLCVNPDHLYIGTDLDNARDRQRRGRGAKNGGENCARAKLTAVQVLEIRRIGRTITQRELGERYGVTGDNISAILARKSWRSLNDKLG